MLTTEQAADILNVSPVYLVGLLENGEIDHTTLGAQYRIKAEDCRIARKLEPILNADQHIAFPAKLASRWMPGLFPEQRE